MVTDDDDDLHINDGTKVTTQNSIVAIYTKKKRILCIGGYSITE